MHTKKELLNEALSLPPIERAALIEELLASFDFPERERIDRLWAQEAEDRIDAYERGEETSTSLESVFEKINQ
jgi:putative addiction module component (TIGR02574 family)